MAAKLPDRPTPSLSAWGAVGRLGSMGFELLAAILTFAALGWGADWLFGTGPWLVVSGLILGVLAGLYRFMREARAATRVKPPR